MFCSSARLFGWLDGWLALSVFEFDFLIPADSMPVHHMMGSD
jgi:hypothetical protein